MTAHIMAFLIWFLKAMMTVLTGKLQTSYRQKRATFWKNSKVKKHPG